MNIDFERDNYKFNARVSAIILNKEKFQSEATGKFLDFLDVDNINRILES